MGKRTGNPRGRPKGSVNKVSAEIRARVAASGLLPHEFLLAVSRGEVVGQHTPSFQERLDAAKAAAPYFAPRLAQIESTSEVTVVHDVSDKPLSPDEWATEFGGAAH